VFIRNILSFGSANLIGQVGRFIQEAALRFILAPEVLGIWSFTLVVFNFGNSIDPGLVPAAKRQLPLFLGAKNYEDFNSFRNSGFFLQAAVKLTVGACIIGYAFITQQDQPYEFWAVISAGVLVFFFGTGEFLMQLFQAKQSYVELGRLLKIYWPFHISLVVAGALWLGAWGVVLGTGIAYVFQIFVFRKSLLDTHFSLKEKFNIKAAKQLLSFGIPFKTVDYPLTILLMSDTIIAVKIFTPSQLVIYSTAKLAVNQLSQVPGWTSQVLIMRINTNMGESNNSKLWLSEEIYQNLKFQFLCLIPALIGSGVTFASLAIHFFLKDYRETIPTLEVLAASLFFMPSVTVFRNFWVLERKFFHILTSNLIGCISMISIVFWFSRQNSLDQTHLAGAFVGAMGIYFISKIFSLGRELWHGAQILKILLFVTLSVGVVCAAGQVKNLVMTTMGPNPYQLFVAYLTFIAILMTYSAINVSLTFGWRSSIKKLKGKK